MKWKKMFEIPSVSGKEFLLSNYLYKKLQNKQIPCIQDSVGNIVIGNYENPKLLFMAHMDQIGIIVTGVLNNGLLSATTIGNIDISLFTGSLITLQGKSEKVLGSGIVLNIKGKKCLFLDIGAKSSAEAQKKISVGDVGWIRNYVTCQENNIIGSGLDDKIGIRILLELLKGKLNNICIVFSVGEETNKKGALNIIKHINPKEAIIVDASPANDCIGGAKNQISQIKLGGGPVINCVSSISAKINHKLQSIANKRKIVLQREYTDSKTFTDGDVLFQKGIPFAVLSFPLRYMHTYVEMCCKDDVYDCIEIISSYVNISTKN